MILSPQNSQLNNLHLPVLLLKQLHMSAAKEMMLYVEKNTGFRNPTSKIWVKPQF
jgi:hypothetical protein